jgi:gliding motility-associated-like protein
MPIYPLRLLVLSITVAAALGNANARDRGLDFVANGHQWPEQVRFRAELPGGAVFLTNTGFTYSYCSQADITRIHDQAHEQHIGMSSMADEVVHGHAYHVNLVGCHTDARSTPQRKVSNYYNFFLGSDPTKWSGGMAAYEQVDYSNLYDAIDLQVYSKEGALKYDFVVAPGGNAADIQLKFEGVDPVLTGKGDLLIRTSVNEAREQAPYAYQVIGGKQQKVACRFALHEGVVSFSFPEGYDHSRALVIDPVLVFATYSGGSGSTFGWSATYDASGNLYAGGQCFATGWPTTTGAFKTSFGGASDAGINKYSSNGSTLMYSTYYGGSNADLPNTMVVNKSGELIVAGATTSTNLPVTSGCYDNSFNTNTDVYVAHFNATGTGLLGATYLGGSGREGDVSTSVGHEANCGEVLVDASDNIYVAFSTTSSNFPTTSGAYQTALSGTMDAFVAKLNGNCSSLLFSTLLGGSATDGALCMQFGTSGSLVIGGGTTSTNLPGVSGAYQSTLQGATDGYIAILNSTGTSLLNATYVGTTATESVSKLQVDKSGNVYVTGSSNAGTFPVSSGVYSVANGENYMAKFNPGLSSLLVSTTIGGSAPLSPSAFLLDVCQNLYFVGYGAVAGLITTGNAYQTKTGGFWKCVLSSNMASLSYASYFGAPGDHIDGGSSRLDPLGIVYHSICTNSTTQPTNSSVWSPTKKVLNSGYDIVSWKFNFELLGLKAGFTIAPKDTLCTPAVVTVTNTSVGALSCLWDFGDGSTSTLAAPPAHTYTKGGIYTIKLLTYNSSACLPIDSEMHNVYVIESGAVKLTSPSPLTICTNDTSRMVVQPYWKISVTPATDVSFQPIGGTEILFYPVTTTTYTVRAESNHSCSVPPVDSLRFTMIRDTTLISHINPITDTILCQGDTAVYELAQKRGSFRITPPTYMQVSKDSMSIRFFPPQTTHYLLTSGLSNQCTSIRDTLDFTIHRSQIQAAFEISPKVTDNHEPEFKLLNRSKSAVSYDWYKDGVYWTGEKNPSFTAVDTGYYCLTLFTRDVYNCPDTAEDCGHMIETHLYLPTAFTPNGDNKNDIFRPIMNNADIDNFSVFNRYGQRVFVTTREDEGWDGTFNGSRCDLGTYFYVLRYHILDREPIMLKGDVTLMR